MFPGAEAGNTLYSICSLTSILYCDIETVVKRLIETDYADANISDMWQLNKFINFQTFEFEKKTT